MPTQPNLNANNNLKKDDSNRNSSVETGSRQQERDMPKGDQRQQRADEPSRPISNRDSDNKGKGADYRQAPQGSKP